MLKYGFIFLGLLIATLGQASNCPDPQTSSLLWGVIPPPWKANPFSSSTPQGGEDTRFGRANILVVRGYGLGVLCAYNSPQGEYSIWWQVAAKIPANTDTNWVRVPGGFRCKHSVMECQFYTA